MVIQAQPPKTEKDGIRVRPNRVNPPVIQSKIGHQLTGVDDQNIEAEMRICIEKNQIYFYVEKMCSLFYSRYFQM